MNKSEIGKAMASLRKPKNMNRGDRAYYQALAAKRKNPGRKKSNLPK